MSGHGRGGTPRRWGSVAALGLAIALCLGLGLEADGLSGAAPSATLRFDPQAQALVLDGLPAPALADPEAAAGHLRVRVDPASSAAAPLAGLHLPDVAGRTYREGRELRFVPAIGWRPGQRYVATYSAEGEDGAAGGEPVVAAFTVLAAEASGEAPRVVETLPLGDPLPQNLLRIYVRFSEPMARGQLKRCVSLLDEAGAPMEDPFLRLGQELWSADMRIATLILDPGRIKRGVAPHEHEGAPLAQGRRYTLVVLQDMRDGQGRPLSQGYARDFRAGEADRGAPSPEAWQLEVPAAGSRAPLTVRLDGPLDPLMAPRLLGVEDAGGALLRGAVSLDPAVDTLSFKPEAPWEAGAYALRVHLSLEDLAGNRVGHAFEMAPGTVDALPSAAPARRVAFTVAGEGPSNALESRAAAGCCHPLTD